MGAIILSILAPRPLRIVLLQNQKHQISSRLLSFYPFLAYYAPGLSGVIFWACSFGILVVPFLPPSVTIFPCRYHDISFPTYSLYTFDIHNSVASKKNYLYVILHSTFAAHSYLFLVTQFSLLCYTPTLLLDTSRNILVYELQILVSLSPYELVLVVQQNTLFKHCLVGICYREYQSQLVVVLWVRNGVITT